MTDAVADNKITVCVRKRPLNKRELNKKEIEVSLFCFFILQLRFIIKYKVCILLQVVTVPNKDHLIVHQPQVKVYYLFDYCFYFVMDHSFGHCH